MSKKGSIPNSSSDLCYGFETICWDKPRKVATTLNNSPDTAAMPPLHILFLIGEGESESVLRWPSTDADDRTRSYGGIINVVVVVKRNVPPPRGT